MTTIDELDEMDFVNWDAAGAETGLDLGSSEGVAQPNFVNDEEAIDLVLEDTTGDDWSFWALQHFESTQNPEDSLMAATIDPLASVEEPLSAMYWEHPEAPCRHCALGGYQCKRIQEGRYKGYCTSCVALRCWCSFGPAGNTAGSEAGATFPANPWPTMGDRPATSILHEDELAGFGIDNVGDFLDADNDKQPSPKAMPKVGARFSRESVRILKNWVATHSRHPYPTEEEKESLQKITGLNKTQITNWLANARRRGKIHPTRSTSPHVGRGYATAIDIPKRRGTPGPLESMNPLQRWENSPPENEPASVTAIARAVTASSSNLSSSSGRNSPYISGYSDDGSSKSLCNQSSASSFSNSHGSSGSFASSFSHQSRGSFGSIPSFVRSNRGRRRRRRAPPKRAEDSLQQPLKTFQCTFCTETFRTKHDWQRHEKSLHLSLERWVCSPDGPTAVNTENGQPSCLFCGEANPNEAHIETHNFSSCTERNLEERTFYRKDHLRQHLKLVHNVKFLPWAMDRWRVSSPQIRSRCGFCGIVMDSWTMRVDHLAEHFKTGNTMADWKGDWGFDSPVLDMVENSIPPYLIHDERNTPLPFMASAGSPSTPNTAYELLKMELQYWTLNKRDELGKMPTDEEMQQEACRIIFGAEVMSREIHHASPSWVRDLVLSNNRITNAAMFRPVRSQAENKSSRLQINGKDNIFEDCELEKELEEFVKARALLGLTAMDQELQVESCKIIGRMEEKSSNPCDEVANWLLRLVNRSPTWLFDFRKRSGLPRSEDVGCSDQRSKDPTTIDSTIYNYSRLERELSEFLQTQRSLGLEPKDADLQRQARMIIYEHDDAWNQTAADDSDWLANFRARHVTKSVTMSTTKLSPIGLNPNVLHFATSKPGAASPLGASPSAPSGSSDSNSSSIRHLRTGPFFLNDANCYRRLAKGLSRFVASTMSANNPNRHVPTDEELQHQARWIVYDDDDPWNQTAADNAEWLQRFKRDVGIIPLESGPGLATDDINWSAEGGGTGFAPPYLVPNPEAILLPFDENPKIFCRDETKPFEPDAATANHFLQTFTHRYPPPAKVFCSRELETGMTGFVKGEIKKTGIFPSDEEMRERAREIMGMQKTPCDDTVLLGKFKALMQNDTLRYTVASTTPVTSAIGSNPLATIPAIASAPSTVSGSPDDIMLPTEMDLTMTEQEMDRMIQGVNDEFGAGSMFNNSPSNNTTGSGSVTLSL